MLPSLRPNNQVCCQIITLLVLCSVLFDIGVDAAIVSMAFDILSVGFAIFA